MGVECRQRGVCERRGGEGGQRVHTAADEYAAATRSTVPRLAGGRSDVRKHLTDNAVDGVHLPLLLKH